ncbi:MAG: hypothetical protein WBP64_13980, partial [Nitrososphaeraceae archaeon]
FYAHVRSPPVAGERQNKNRYPRPSTWRGNKEAKQIPEYIQSPDRFSPKEMCNEGDKNPAISSI